MSRKSSSPRNMSLKFLYRCGVPTDGYLWIEQLLHRSSVNSGVLKGLLDRKKQVVVKFGSPNAIAHEYRHGEALKDLPNFMRFYCTFSCDEDAKDVLTRDYAINHTICKNPGDQLGFAMMPYYNLGSVASYRWDIRNIAVLKSVLKQVAIAVLVAYQMHGFVHKDLHLDNILLRATKKAVISYTREIKIETLGVYAVVMDFERSTTDGERVAPREAYQDVARMVYLAATMGDNSDLGLDPNDRDIGLLMSNNTPVTPAVLQRVCTAIDGIKVRYEKSRIPANPFAKSR